MVRYKAFLTQAAYVSVCSLEVLHTLSETLINN